MSIAATIKRHIPWPVRRLSRRIKRTVRQRLDSRLNCKDVFTRIYAMNAWGGSAGEIYSGPGSGEEAAKPYAEAVLPIRQANIQSVADLGCGTSRWQGHRGQWRKLCRHRHCRCGQPATTSFTKPLTSGFW